MSLPPFYDSINKFGRNTDVDTSAEDIWDGAGTYSWPTVAQVHDITSGDATDDDGNTGARTVQVLGLDANYYPATETVTMNGTSNVPTSNSYIRIYRMYVVTAGSNGANAGNITATGQTDATVTAQITAAFNQTLMAIYTIPADSVGYMANYYGAINRTTSTLADITLKVRQLNQVFQIKHVLSVSSTGTSYFSFPFVPHLTIPAKSDIIISAISSAVNTDITAGFGIYLGRT